MTSRTRLPGAAEDESAGPDAEKGDAVSREREILAKYLGYVLADVAALDPTSALLLDQAIARLLDAPSEHNSLRPLKYS